MKNTILIIASIIGFYGCSNAQQDNLSSKNNGKTTKKIEPKTDYKVNKEYDKNGNLTKYDSTYTYYYSNVDKKSLMKDSVVEKLNKLFTTHDFFNNDPFFNTPFSDKEFSEENFFKEDFFRSNNEMMQKMLSQMDSLKNQFFLNEYPLKEKKESKK